MLALWTAVQSGCDLDLFDYFQKLCACPRAILVREFGNFTAHNGTAHILSSTTRRPSSVSTLLSEKYRLNYVYCCIYDHVKIDKHASRILIAVVVAGRKNMLVFFKSGV